MSEALGEERAPGAGPAIVLVEPQLGENIGMVARAMANFSLTDLRLVKPRDGWPSEKARAAASRADHVIDAVRLFDTVEAATADLNFVLATTARPRDSFKPVRGPEEASLDLRRRVAEGQGTGILFGRERWGLNNHEVGLADEIVTFPVDPNFASLNIAQAVLLMSYAWQVAGKDGDLSPRFSAKAPPSAAKEDLFRLFDHLEASLERAGYFFPEPKREVLTQNLRTMLTKANFSEPEVRTLRGVIKAFDHEAGRLAGGSPNAARDGEE
ncbi:RNA methyltransferase [Jiella sp. MQZ9-1]|uniref:RNA methyltransferase n=1 Tax=Jiella flava TaxID=2816857 RepID=UPI001E3E49B7|nr:RNA methyltransferase [Jiella flava]